MSEKPLKLVEKCYDPEEYGYLYGFNRPVTDSELEKVKPYMKKFSPELFKNIMAITGDPHGWMCTKENTKKVEKTLNIQDTIEKQLKKQEEKKQYYEKNRHKKEEALAEIEEIFKNAQRPPQRLETLLKAAMAVYDPANSYRDNRFYGRGQLFIVTKRSIWYIINNSKEYDNRKINNIEVNGVDSAIGFRIKYDEEVDRLIQTLTEKNPYKPSKFP